MFVVIYWRTLFLARYILIVDSCFRICCLLCVVCRCSLCLVVCVVLRVVWCWSFCYFFSYLMLRNGCRLPVGAYRLWCCCLLIVVCCLMCVGVSCGCCCCLYFAVRACSSLMQNRCLLCVDLCLALFV